MTLHNVIDQYIAWRQAHGAKFDTSARGLRDFSRQVGENREYGSITKEEVLGFLAGKGPLTRTRANRHGALVGFYRYAISRDHGRQSPLPPSEEEPRPPESAPPYVFSRDELQRLFGSIDTSRQRPTQLDADTLRGLLRLLYGAGLRFGEAAPDVRRGQPVRCGPDHPRHQALQDPSRAHRPATVRGPEGLRGPAGGPTFARRNRFDLPGQR